MKLLRLLPILTLSSALATEIPPEWIRVDGKETQVFEHEFWIDEPVTDFTREITRVVFSVTADFAAVDVKINDAPVGSVEPYDPVTEFEILHHYTAGSNRIELSVHPVNGPSAVAAELKMFPTDKPPLSVATSAGEWGGIEGSQVHPHRWGRNHLPEVAASAEYNQWKEALEDPTARSISPLPNGFTLTKIYDATPEQDSWVSMVVERDGSILVGQEEKGILRLSLS
ncbi:MAG: hypothetical protein AAGC68_07385, partial [Verrucomicrobiota bacterium]